MKILSTKLLIVALICLNNGSLFAKMQESSSSVDQSEKLAKEKAHRDRFQQLNERLKTRIMEASQRNIEAITILAEPYDSDDDSERLLHKLTQLLNRTQNLLQLSDNSKMIV